MQRAQRIVLDEEESIESIQSLLSSGKKEKKKKTPKEEYLISTGKKRMKPKPSVIAETANDLIRLGYNTPEKISAYFTSKARIVDPQQQKLYLLLVKSKVSLGKFVLSDDLANRPFQLYLLVPNFITKVISNDWLWFALMYKRQIDAESTGAGPLQSQNMKWVKKMFEDAVVRSVQIMSNTFKCKEDVEKGYYQDYITNFACIGIDKKSDEEKTNLCNSDNIYKFKYNNYNFCAKGEKGECIIYIDSNNITNQNLLDQVKACKVISVKERKPTLKEKVIEMKNEAARYIECRCSPEKFCPAFLRTAENVRYYFYIVAILNYNLLFEYMDNDLAESGSIHYYENSWYWTTTESWFDFYYVYGITSRSASQEQKQEIVGRCDFYFKYQDYILAWKKHQLILQKIYQDFYMSFSTKINWDKANSLYDRIVDYIDFRDFLMFDEAYDKMLDWLKDLPFCKFIQNQFKKEIIAIADKLKDCLFLLVKKRGPNNAEELVKAFKEIGLMIYYACPNETNNSAYIPAFNMIVPSGAFLGYVFEGDNAVKNILAENLIRVANQGANIENRNDELMKKVENIMSDIDKYRRIVVDFNVKKIGENVGVNFNNEEIKAITTKVLQDLISPNSVIANREINNAIIAAVKNGQSLQNLSINKQSFVDFVKKFAVEKKQKIDEAAQENAKINSEINNLSSRRDQNTSIIAQGGPSVAASVPQSQNIPQGSIFGDSMNVEEQASQGQVSQNVGGIFNSPGIKFSTSPGSLFQSNINPEPTSQQSAYSGESTASTNGWNELDFKIANYPNNSWNTFQKLLQSGEIDKSKLFSGYYSLIAYMSGIYPSTFSSPYVGMETPVKTLVKDYPVRPSVFEAVITDQGLPDVDRNGIKQWISSNKTVKRKGADYTDQKYVYKVLKSVYGF
jgi:hypothetical protein